MFSPQTVPKVKRGKGIDRLERQALAPWEPGHDLRPEPLQPRHVWQHRVYDGVYKLTAVTDTLIEAFGPDPDALDERMGGESAMFAFTVTDDGRILLDTVVLSTCAWALGRVRDPGPDDAGWIDGFDDDAQWFQARVDGLGVPSESERRPLDGPAGELADAVVSGTTDAVGRAVGAAAATTLGPVGGAITGHLATSATKALLDQTIDDLDDLDEEDKREDDGGNKVLRVGPYPVTGEHVHDLVIEVAEKLGIEDLGDLEVRVQTVQAPEAAQDSEPYFLNSFHLPDLVRVAASVRSAQLGPALDAYLTPASRLTAANRTDVRRDREVVNAGVLPSGTPLGRWPANFPLVLSQQFAVNTMRSELTSGGLFSVNGPPGTGKTTMLRDLIADVVVQRAQRLAALPSPSAAFESTELSWTTGRHRRVVRPLRPELTGYEIVVASSNNGAVENVSKAIPARGELGDRWRDDADYLADHATRLLKGEPGWGALAAVLGKMANRSEFVHRFWWGDEEAGDLQPDGSRRRRIRKRRWQGTHRGFHDQLGAWRDETGKPTWAQVRDQFRQAVRRVEELTRERARAAEALRNLPAAQQEATAASESAAAQRIAVEKMDSEVQAARQAYAASQQSETECFARLRQHQDMRPSILSRAATKRAWSQREELLTTELGVATEQRAAAAAVFADCDGRHRRLVSIEDQASARAEVSTQRFQQYATEIDSALRRWPTHVPTPDATDADRELSAPWSDDAISQARAEVFLAALELHKQFFRLAAGTMRTNLLAAMDVVNGNAPPDLDDKTAVAAWQSLFLVVPVVSTTFASFGRMFGCFGQDSIGWVFIDEAGQANPQEGVGALWRAQRAVVVGDPLQLEPISVLPWTGQEALRRTHNVEAEWAAKSTSVQRVADRTNRFGTTLPADLPDGSQEVWVGAPLRVHRRCDRPMFDISNAIAYDNMMVFGTPARPEPRISRSCWVNVVSTESDANWVPAEGKALRTMLEKLHTSGIKPEDVFVISPYRAVVSGVHRLLKKAQAEAGHPLARDDRVGTVHRTQGKESKVVILVLGSDPRRDGSRRWATNNPNLINVAVSRAQRRLYVIGDLERWSRHPYTSLLAKNLRRWDFPSRREG
ncbi:ATP-binding protein [Actinocatenispora sera]|uniref:DEAD/DEAH box helicase n=1 Tax=Actinocatenispora sera TaxID=390989 RepID=UPI003409AACD